MTVNIRMLSPGMWRYVVSTGVYRRLGGSNCFHIRGRMTEPRSIRLNLFLTKLHWRNISEAIAYFHLSPSFLLWAQDSVVGIVTRLRTGRPRNFVWFRAGQEIFLLSKTSTPVPGPTGRHMQLALVALSSDVMFPGCDDNHGHRSSALLRMGRLYGYPCCPFV